MTKTLEAIESGRVVQYNADQPRFYRMVDGRIYFSDRNEEAIQWKPSNAKKSIFHNDVDWIIL